MPQFDLSDFNPSANVDLGASLALTVTNTGATSVKVHIDYLLNSNWSSAIKASAGYRNPFKLDQAMTKIVALADLESLQVRVGVDGDNFQVSVVY